MTAGYYGTTWCSRGYPEGEEYSPRGADAAPRTLAGTCGRITWTARCRRSSASSRTSRLCAPPLRRCCRAAIGGPVGAGSSGAYGGAEIFLGTDATEQRGSAARSAAGSARWRSSLCCKRRSALHAWSRLWTALVRRGGGAGTATVQRCDVCDRIGFGCTSESITREWRGTDMVLGYFLLGNHSWCYY